jgi:hypothetical protein
MPARTKPRDLFAGMNKTEAAYAQYLEADKRNGVISEWFYEALTFKLGQDCRYTPDFMVIDASGIVSFVETKGFMRDDALVKLKTFAKQFPFRLTLCTLKNKHWTYRPITHIEDEEIGPICNTCGSTGWHQCPVPDTEKVKTEHIGDANKMVSIVDLLRAAFVKGALWTEGMEEFYESDAVEEAIVRFPSTGINGE